MTDSTPSIDLSGLAPLPDRLRLPLTFEVAALADEVRSIVSNEWVAHFVAENYSGDWSIFPLRVPVGVEHPILRITSTPDTQWEDGERLAELPAMSAVRAAFDCEIEAMRLMRLGPGSEIHEHRDADLSADYGMARLHIPVLTNPEVEFRLAGVPVTMLAGECWYLRLSERHAVANRGTTDRIHLVLDAKVNDWLAALLLDAAKLAR